MFLFTKLHIVDLCYVTSYVLVGICAGYLIRLQIHPRNHPSSQLRFHSNLPSSCSNFSPSFHPSSHFKSLPSLNIIKHISNQFYQFLSQIRIRDLSLVSHNKVSFGNSTCHIIHIYYIANHVLIENKYKSFKSLITIYFRLKICYTF